MRNFRTENHLGHYLELDELDEKSCRLNVNGEYFIKFNSTFEGVLQYVMRSGLIKDAD